MPLLGEVTRRLLDTIYLPRCVVCPCGSCGLRRLFEQHASSGWANLRPLR